MTIKDKFNDLKSVIVGSSSKRIDAKLDLAVQGISSYKSQSGRNGYIDLVKSIISKSSGLDVSSFGGFGTGGQNVSPASLGQGNRLQRYKAYESIIANINYCNRALNVIRDNILSPDDITKISLNISPKAFLEDKNVTSTEIGHVKKIIASLKLEKYLSMILYNTLLYGDFFCEIANNRTALTSRSILSENYIISKDIESEMFETITEQHKEEKYTINMDYLGLYEDELKDKNTKDKKEIDDISLLYHEPKRVVRLQSSTIPICFGYLIFPHPELMSPYGNVEEDMINTLCISILQNVEKKVPEMKVDGIQNVEDVKDIIKSMIGANNMHKAVKVRYVSPNKMIHFKVPTTKFFPYGESIFDSTQFSSKVLIALETALTIQRLSRSTEKRKISVEIGLPRDAKKVIEELKRTFNARKITLDSFGSVDTIPCFDLSTGIKLTNGKSIELGEMIKFFNTGSEFEVYAYDRESGKVRPDKVVNAEITGKDAEVVEITLDNNKSEICTPEHLWMSRDGNYVMAKDLKPGDSLLPLYTKTTNYHTSNWCPYREVLHPGINEWELVHRSFGKYLGLYDNGNEVIHHINKNPTDNSSDNLQGLTRKEHIIIHGTDIDNARRVGRDNVVKISFNCIVCGKEFEKGYWDGKTTCSDECFSKYKKLYSYNSWLKRKDKNEYQMIEISCDNCGKKIEIGKTIFDRVTQKDYYFSCDDPICKRIVNKLNLSHKFTPIYYNYCETCNNLFATRSDKVRWCSRRCANISLNKRRWEGKSEIIHTICDICGGEVEISKYDFDRHRFVGCNNIECQRQIRALNTFYTKNNKKTYIDIYFDKCIICGKLVCFSEKKAGFDYYTCGSKSCSSTSMHRGLTRYQKVMNHKVKKITFLKKKVDVGDIQTEKFHNFALSSGVFVHNSQISTFEDIFIPTKDGKSFVDINTMTDGNVDIRSKVDELKYVRDSIIAGLQVPPSFIGLEENLSNKAALSEENILFARTIIGYQKHFSEQVDELIEKVYEIIEPEKALTLLDNVSIALPPPKSLQYEREARYLGELATLVETLERIGIPREYSKQKYLSSIDWDEVKKYQTEQDLSSSIGTNEPEEGGQTGMGGMGGMGGGLY